jgi:putative membrane protein insertion efficiency factor
MTDAALNLFPRIAAPAARLGATIRLVPRRLARGLVALYRLTLSPLIGFNCRHVPTCSQYAEEAIERFGLWAGGWMTLARLLRCQPFGTSGLDFVPAALPAGARWYLPWRYGRWRGVNRVPAPPATPLPSP